MAQLNPTGVSCIIAVAGDEPSSAKHRFDSDDRAQKLASSKSSVVFDTIVNEPHMDALRHLCYKEFSPFTTFYNLESIMAIPDRVRPGSLVTAGRKTLLVRTASGQLVAPKPGERVTIDDVRRMVDTTFVFDTTGSMSSKLESLQQCMVEFVRELATFKLDWRFSLLPFGDLTVPSDLVVGDLPFVTDADAAIRMIRSAPHFSGGGNLGESSLEAMQAAINKPYRKGAVKVIVLLTDEPPLTGQLSAGEINRQLKSGEFICFVASPAGCGFEAMARDNGGKWYLIGPSLNTADLLSFLRQLLKNVSRVSNDVHRLGGGSVARYLASPDRKALE